MTDTRKEFEEFYKNEPLAGSECYDWCLQIWQACQSLNDKRIQQLLAVIELQQKALQFYADGGHWDYNDTMTKETYLNDKGEKAAEALAINPGDVELVNVAAVDAMETGVEWNPETLDNVKSGDLLYAITKERV